MWCCSLVALLRDGAAQPPVLTATAPSHARRSTASSCSRSCGGGIRTISQVNRYSHTLSSTGTPYLDLRKPHLMIGDSPLVGVRANSGAAADYTTCRCPLVRQTSAPRLLCLSFQGSTGAGWDLILSSLHPGSVIAIVYISHST